MIKPISIVLAVGLAAASAGALADDPDYSTASASHLQRCIAKQKAKSDGRTDSDITQYCIAKMQKKHESNMSTAPAATPPSPPTPASPNDPNETMPNDTRQDPR